MRKNILKQCADGLASLFFPVLCENCARPLLESEAVLCLHCIQLLPLTNYHHIVENETALRFAGRIPFIYATSYAYFTGGGMLQHLLHGLKYNNKKETGVFLGRQLGYELKDAGWEDWPDLIVPVPLYAAKEAARGYNQSTCIVSGLSETLNIPADNKLMQRTRHTESQTQKTRQERVANVQDAFTLKGSVAGKHILLVDDVLTTGATLESCALTLISAGARVSIATIALATD
ncbi:ComF family protein [Chitinophagaceae bacterium MMS25-I14]